ncbi:NAD-dependent epimerase/dehydratase family protein [Vibrio splendidus]
MMKKVLVIGASGSLGKGFVKHIEDTAEVVATYSSNEIMFDNAKTCKLDITNENDFDLLDKDFDAVYLIAGAMPASMEGYNEQKYIDVNVTGTLNTLKFCKRNGIRKIIYIMTFSDVSGNFYNAVPIEDDQAREINYTGDHALYAISKISAQEIIKHYADEYGIQNITFRIPTVYCNDDNINYYVDGVLKEKSFIQMIKSIRNNSRIELWGDVNNAKDMPYIKDFSNLLEKALYNDKAYGIFNAGTHMPISLEEFVDTLIKVFANGDLVEKIYLPENKSQPNFTFSMEKTYKEFDFKPLYSLEEAFSEIKIALIDSGVIDG